MKSRGTASILIKKQEVQKVYLQTGYSKKKTHKIPFAPLFVQIIPIIMSTGLKCQFKTDSPLKRPPFAISLCVGWEEKVAKQSPQVYRGRSPSGRSYLYFQG